jgi:hypothetical protein
MSKGTFFAIMASPITERDLHDWLQSHQIPHLAPLEQRFHVTVMKSSTSLPSLSRGVISPPLVIPRSNLSFDVLETRSMQRALILAFQHDHLTQRHRSLLDAGAISIYNEFKPHLTLCYDISGISLKDIVLPDFDLVFDFEYQEPLL